MERALLGFLWAPLLLLPEASALSLSLGEAPLLGDLLGPLVGRVSDDGEVHVVPSNSSPGKPLEFTLTLPPQGLALLSLDVAGRVEAEIYDERGAFVSRWSGEVPALSLEVPTKERTVSIEGRAPSRPGNYLVVVRYTDATGSWVRGSTSFVVASPTPSPSVREGAIVPLPGGVGGTSILPFDLNPFLLALLLLVSFGGGALLLRAFRSGRKPQGEPPVERGGGSLEDRGVKLRGTRRRGSASSQLVDAGRKALLEGRADAAMGAFEAAILADPEFAPAHLARALLLEEIGEKEEAEREFQRATELHPHDPLSPYHHARALVRRGEFSRAIELLFEAVRRDPTFAERAWREEAFGPLKDHPSFAEIMEYGRALSNP